MINQQITYSRAYTLVPTYDCFNRCSYCNFRTDIGKSPWLTLTEAEKILKSLQNQGIIEILVLSGEVHPNSSQRLAWFKRIYELCELAISLGFLPHTNVGPLNFTEMTQLKQVNVSMGLMLEQINPKLLETVHHYSPSKIPGLRLKQLEWAGELKIPFTTGLLLGIGETSEDMKETLNAITMIHKRWGHIQEVILQPHSLGSQQSDPRNSFNLEKLPEVIAIAHSILPADITLQIPPNLVTHPDILLACLEAGARDLGGIGPRDEVNPDYPQDQDQTLQTILAPNGWELVRRLPVYPQYDPWVCPDLQGLLTKWRKKLAISETPVLY
ncbi:7,8-didemethyl-8-hydroxy-5-deazariboflavin synthase subunit CofG [Planktothrix agardhii 1029]|uniref:7,8-didemethyl-8-hydroxy-5-deazariboflavin synthase subunit CofG n=1 Tax=Planktothrix agardhii TaxID=1160 RepID=UPI001D0B91F0|nr:7,8-didemethyl-8-hydroxy-5-deazariboflavin synthase subunit CofG [Planktothrix agardhii]MCB8764704.1 7,8-didemethyl-8-hydroxy-5-deazariboflavin synthase subunit CofG [Planktothrix agardhii 1809]MCB8778352.1 7,8-didemethyl-8-hydroxy-5-deazariboflavin synthase subunit CofG [Planktothrix agardhii 1031]MCF3566211.1 7,8-didemethyl-8-hydroxy-5-deazariboflavin synthase subunit CofG [Planktothrix agardhii 1807]MCF3588721.1 7,8-didemethyl-8-hydroxy-5-deazariboflavin synthase subunit CofG [Planktothri